MSLTGLRVQLNGAAATDWAVGLLGRHYMYSCWVVGDGALTARCCDILRENERSLLGVVTDSPMVADWGEQQGCVRRDPRGG